MPRVEREFVEAEDLYRLRLVTACEISPDGGYVAYAVQRVVKRTEKKCSNLWIVPTRGGRPRQFTAGDHVDSEPKWSPDGKWIAFLSNRQDEKQFQIYLIPSDGGEARRLTNLKGTIRHFDWSPDGRKLVLLFRRKDPEEIAREKDKARAKLGIVCRRITRTRYKLDGEGYLPREEWRVWTVDSRSGRASQLTELEAEEECPPCWSPDGERILFGHNASPDPDLEPEAIDLFLIPARGGKARKLNTPFGIKFLPSFSPDGKWVAYCGVEGRGEWWRNTNVWIVPAGGTGGARNLTGSFDVDVNGHTINDLEGYPVMTPPTWSRDGESIFFTVARHGNTVLKSVAVRLRKGRLRDVVERKGVVGAFRFDRDQRLLAYYFGDLTEPGNIWVRDMASGADRKITRVNENFLRRKDLGRMEETWIRGPAGNRIHGWILKPPGFDARKKYPSILEVHGGPQVQYGNLFMHEFYFLAARGYVVFFSNPRGGQGYGEKHCKAIWGDWGGADYDDLMAWTDYVRRKPYIDSKRMGVTGGSYGGFMTNWIIGHTRRFAAAVTQRSISNMISKYGSSDFNWQSEHRFRGKPPWENLREYWRQSPLKYVGAAKTPTLVIHSEQDLRCPMEQGQQMFIALKRLGVDTEMIVFPDEPHGLSRVGRTDRRIARLNHILRWFVTYLKRGGGSGRSR